MTFPPNSVEPFPERNPFGSEYHESLNFIGEAAMEYWHRRDVIDRALVQFDIRETRGGSKFFTVYLKDAVPTAERDPQGKPLQFLYTTWYEVRPTGSETYDGWDQVDGGLTEVDGIIRNKREFYISAITQHGSGYDMSDIPPGFFLRHVALDTPVTVEKIQGPEGVEYWIDVPLVIGGECEMPE